MKRKYINEISLLLFFPGSNCDRDMFNAAIKSGVEAEYVDYKKHH